MNYKLLEKTPFNDGHRYLTPNFAGTGEVSEWSYCVFATFARACGRESIRSMVSHRQELGFTNPELLQELERLELALQRSSLTHDEIREQLIQAVNEFGRLI